MRLNQGGQSLVEAVLVIPVFIFLVLAVVQTGFAMIEYQVVHYACFEASRAGAIYFRESESQARLQSQITAAKILSGLGFDKASAAVVKACREQGDWRVCIYYHLKIVLPVPDFGKLAVLPAECRLPIEDVSNAEEK